MRLEHILKDKSGNELVIDSSKIYSFDDGGDFLLISETTYEKDQPILTRDTHRSPVSLAMRNINSLFNKAIQKSPNGNIPLTKIVPGPYGNILVSQGEGVNPAWKTYASIFPSGVSYIEGDESIILQGSTLSVTNFIGSPYILRGEYISEQDTPLETIDFTTESGAWYSHFVDITFTPILMEILTSDSTAMVIPESTPLTYNKETRFIIKDKNGAVRLGISIPRYTNAGDYKVYKAELGWTVNDVELYLADHTLKTSITDLDFDYHNYVINDLDYVTPMSKYDIEVWGDVNSFSTNIPVTSSLIQGCIGYGFGLIIDGENNMFGFGSNTNGQINIPEDKMISASCGKKHSCGITVDGELRSWGNDYYGQVTQTPKTGIFKKVVCADYATAAISDTNELFIWGELFFPFEDPTFSTLEVKDIAFGKDFFIIQRTDGTLEGFGNDAYGQISDIPGGKFISFDCGDYHVAGITDYNTLEVWGSNDNLQLDHGLTVFSGFKSVQCGNYYTIALKTDGTIVAFGNDNKGCVSGASSVQKYNMICAKYDNVLGFKNETFMVGERYKKNVVSGEKFALQVAFSNKGTALSSIKVHLDLQ